jgi:hypothetical protein
MITRATDLQFNTDRQKWQVICSVYQPNLNNPNLPTAVNDFQGIRLDCANSSPTAIKQACAAFANAVESIAGSETTSLIGAFYDTDSNQIIT